MCTGIMSTSNSSSDSSVVAGLELGHLLGRGSFGWVYYGTYYGTSVAVKVSQTQQAPQLGCWAVDC